MLATLAATLIFLLPFERIPSLDLAGITIRLSSIVLLIFWGYLFLRKRDWLKPKTLLDRAVLALYATGWLSVLFATDHVRSIKVMLLWSFALGAYILISRSAKLLSWEKIEQFVVASMVVTTIFGLYQFVMNSYFGLPYELTLLSPNYVRDILGFARIQSVGIEPLYYASSLYLAVAFVSVRMLTTKKVAWREAGLMVLALTVLILTLSRGAYLGTLAGLVVVIGLLIWQKLIKTTGVIVLLLSAVLSYGIFQGMIHIVPSDSGNAAEDFIEHAIGGEETRGSSVDPRLAAIKDAVAIYRTAPISGVGIGNYGTLTTLQKTAENGQPIVNNQYLETLTEQGPLGLIALLAVIGVALYKLYLVITKQPKLRLVAIALAAAFVAFLVQWNFFSTIYIVLGWAMLGLINRLSDE